MLFQKLEFKNLLTRFSKENVEERGMDFKAVCIKDLTDCETVFTKAKEAKQAACLLLQEEGSVEFAGLALCFGTENSYVFLPEGFLTL